MIIFKGAKPDQLPIAIMSQKRKKDIESIVILRLKDFIDWFGAKKE